MHIMNSTNAIHNKKHFISSEISVRPNNNKCKTNAFSTSCRYEVYLCSGGWDLGKLTLLHSNIYFQTFGINSETLNNNIVNLI